MRQPQFGGGQAEQQSRIRGVQIAAPRGYGHHAPMRNRAAV
jgi:hypothetical protein